MAFKSSAVLSLLLVLVIYSFGQEPRGKNEIGIHVGGFFYLGDLTPGFAGSLLTGKPALGIYYNRSLSSYFSLRANFMIGALAGDESLFAAQAFRRHRNFRFNTPIGEAALLAQYDVFGTNGTIPATKISPYFFAGIGVSFLNINRDWSRVDTSMLHAGSYTQVGLTTDLLTVPPKIIPVIPVGVGVKYHLSQRIALTAEANYRFTFTDYLDGFSYAANPSRKDGYFSTTVGAVYNFGQSGNGKGNRGSTNCPSARMF